MKTHARPSWFAAVPIVLVALFAWTPGCNIIPPAQADLTRFYVLSEPVAVQARSEAAGGLRIGLGRVETASYLKSREMVVRRGTNEISFREYARWAEPLDSAIARMLTENLAAAPQIGRLFTAPFPLEAERDYDVSVQVVRCEGTAETATAHAGASFSAIVDISTPPPESRIVAHHLFTAPAASWDDRNYGRLAGLLGNSVTALAQDILSSLPDKAPAPDKTSAPDKAR